MLFYSLFLLIHVSDVDAVAVMSPLFFKPESIGNLVNYLRDIAQHAPTKPILYYDNRHVSRNNYNITLYKMFCILQVYILYQIL